MYLNVYMDNSIMMVYQLLHRVIISGCMCTDHDKPHELDEPSLPQLLISFGGLWLQSSILELRREGESLPDRSGLLADHIPLRAWNAISI